MTNENIQQLIELTSTTLEQLDEYANNEYILGEKRAYKVTQARAFLDKLIEEEKNK